MTRLVASFASVLVVAGLAAAADAPRVPRYKFEPGQEMTYRTTSTFKYGEKKTAGEYGSRIDWTVWVVRPNKDGSSRLIIRQEDASYQVFDGKKREKPAQSRLVYADVFPDGRILPNDTIKFHGHPGSIFPKLPKDAATLSGKEKREPEVKESTPADWPTHNHDPAGWRFNPAEKPLGPTNVGKLVEKWRFPAASSKETLGVVHGNIVFSGPARPKIPAAAPGQPANANEPDSWLPKQSNGSVRRPGQPKEDKKREDQPTPRTPAGPVLPEDVEKRSVKIFSNGTRMAGNLYLPKGRKPEEKLPAVVLCAGTGGTKENTGGRLGPILAQHGYIALAFDYRGWGESESQVMAVAEQPKPDAKNEMTIKVRALRGQMNYTDQTEDIRAAISYLVGEPGVDRKRIGLWGTSYGGGLVTWVAGNDPRIKCFVAQVPGMGVGGPAMTKAGYDLATKQARGETEPAPVETGKLTGALARYKEMRWNPARSVGFSAVDAATRIKVPALFVVAEKEELANNEIVERVHKDLVKRGVSSTYHVLKGMTHYGVYNKGFKEATRVEVEWYDAHLKK